MDPDSLENKPGLLAKPGLTGKPASWNGLTNGLSLHSASAESQLLKQSESGDESQV